MSKQKKSKNNKTVLQNLQTQIKNAAKVFLPAEVINEFIALIQPWESKLSNYFFQITGKTDPPKLEFGCHAGNVLVDITFSEKEKSTNIIALKHVGRVEYRETGESVQLSIHCSGNQAYFYESSTHENRECLKSYADHVARIVGEPEMWVLYPDAK
ncbi:MAG: hypothetical protein JXB88_05995 [Spirochaetales bacterium]|nr:hypothetical protein [Spirochaetales bacterium]